MYEYDLHFALDQTFLIFKLTEFYFPDKILHSEDEAFTMTDLPLSMYRTSSKLTLKNYHEGLKGIYT